MMRKTILAAAAVLALGGGTVAAWTTAVAQPAPPPEAAAPGGMGGPDGRMAMHGPGMMREGGMMGGPGRRFEHFRMMRRLGALIVPTEDRKLAGPDVQKIAEAFLLWNGNHSWKVTEVTENPDNTVGFAFATPSGDVIARFTMDRRSGHVERVS